MGFGNADAGVRYRQNRAFRRVADGNFHLAAGPVVLDGIGGEVGYDGGQKMGHTGDRDRISLKNQGNVPLLGHGFQFCQSGCGGDAEIHRLHGVISAAFVQTGQLQNILHQTDHSLNFQIDPVRKPAHILRGHHTVFQQFGISGDGMEGGLQFMGNIGSEFPPLLFQLLLFGDIYHQQHHAGDLFAGTDRAGSGLVNSGFQGNGAAAPTAVEGLIQRGL